jgi:hypothetical protein
MNDIATTLTPRGWTSSKLSDAVQRVLRTGGNIPSSKNGDDGLLYSSGGLVYVADQAVRHGVLLEQQGHAAQSVAAFHEAAVYYECRLQNDDAGEQDLHPFAHVT